jgi:TDG/mug DNA glycosylase family protein
MTAPGSRPFKPTPTEVAAAYGKRVPDLLRPGLRIVFVGINPSLYSAAVGQHFARPGNRFWPVLHAAGLTPRRLSPFEGNVLLALGYGITNLVGRATAAADELAAGELRGGARRLARKIRRFRPRFIAFLGVTAYRVAFDRPRAGLGRQSETLAEVPVWVLPNPSGLNAHYRLADLTRLFAALRRATAGPRP